MGQGYSLTTLSAGSAGIDVPELGDLVYEKSLGNARFMKSIRARHKDGLVVTKVVMRPYPELKLDKYVKALIRERNVLSEVPNALAYNRIIETSTNGYLVRQFIHSSLYDRMSTRPFLEDIEKKWLAFQLLCAVRDCHARNIYHGDIKTENILVTSWNWLFLSDLSSSYKPAYLPEDNPADFSFYFDTSGRRTCYLAPERFLTNGSQPDNFFGVNWAMDIFSVGCVIAELFLETPIFNLSQLFKYRQGEYDPEHTHLSKIEDSDIRELVTHMIQVEPESRFAAEEYLNFWRRRAFPDYFYSFLHQYMYAITDPTAGRKPITAGGENLGESDERIDKLYNDFDKISYFLGSNGKEEMNKRTSSRRSAHSMFPLYIDIPNYRHEAGLKQTQDVDDGTLIFLTLVVASIRSTARAASRIRACELLLAFAERTTDEAKFDRILPYLMGLLNDKSDFVRVTALRTMTQLLALVSVVSPGNAYIFPEYILPRLQPFIPDSTTKPSRLLRMTYATCLASLATTASRFLDMMQALRADGLFPTTDPQAELDSMSQSTYHNLYDVAHADLVNQFEGHVTAILTDNDSAVKRAFLGSVSSLCVFFGTTKANDVILSHLNTYLNDKDWMLKCAFFETIIGVATYVGSTSLEEFILPLMVQALTDAEEFVVEKVIRSLAAMAELGLFQRSRTWELVDVVGRFTIHPNIWIREAAAQFISASTTYLSIADLYCIITPLIKPYLKVVPSTLSELKLLDSLKRPLPRLVVDLATRWATQSEKGIFWRPAKRQRTFTFGSSDNSLPTISAKDLGPKALSKVPKTDEDEQWLAKLRSMGLTSDDEFKLLALREYIWRVAHRKTKSDDEQQLAQKLSQIYPLKDIGIAPQTVFFDHNKELLDQGLERDRQVGAEEVRKHRTIADALLDAQSTVDDPMSRRKLSHMNAHAGKLARDASNNRRANSSPPPNGSARQGPRDGVGRPSIGLLSRESSDDQDTGSGLRSPQSPYSTSPQSAAITGEHPHPVRRKGSAISLLNRGDTGNKASAEIGTNSENAVGKVDGHRQRDVSVRREPVPSLATAQEQHRANPNIIKYQAAHSYTGNDPSVLKLLDALYLENYPVDDVEFGPIVTPISTLKSKQINSQTSPSSFRPEGILIGMLSEHTKAIRRVVPAPDHTYFLTGADDGAVKVWDTSRLERNITHRSRQTYKLNGDARVTSLCSVQNTYCFAATGSDGTIHIVKVDSVQSSSGPRYGKLRVLRHHELPDGQYAVWCEHFKNENQSTLLVATNTSRIVAIDLRTMNELYTLSNPLHHGTPTCFAVDSKNHYLLLGTSHGVLDLWDLRFRLRLRAWGMSGGSAINRITLRGVRGRKGARAFVAGGTGQGEVTVWDVEKGMVCTDVYRTGLAKDPNPKSMTLVDIDEEKPGGMLGRFAHPVDPTSTSSGLDHGITAFDLGTASAREGAEPKQSFILTAGPDWKVRYWDSPKPESSAIVNGLDLDESKPTYSVSHQFPETTLVTERLAVPPRIQQSRGSSIVRDGSKDGSSTTADGRSGSATPATSNSSAKRSAASDRSGKPSRNSIISMQQQQLLKSHLDKILDVALVEHPFPMCVSVDRGGVIFVFK